MRACREHFGLGFLLTVILFSAGRCFASAEADRADLFFLNRIAYGVNPGTLSLYLKAGRERYLKEQLVFRGDDSLPVAVRRQIADMDISRLDTGALIAERHVSEQQLKANHDPDLNAKLQQEINRRGNEIAFQSAERRILRSLYSGNQLQEQLTWFWFNHFNVFQHKGNINLLIPDYEEHAIRPHVLGKFRDLLLATVTHPAMLVYLDNAQNAAGSVNENYAREIMELHTMGVDGGYTQGDVEALARILTGVGVDFSGCRGGQTLLWNVAPSGSGNLFCFNPGRHDQEKKEFLGQDFPAGGGAEEVIRAIDLLIREPATAHHISYELAVYFLDDHPKMRIVDEMARTFARTDGDIARTLSTLFESKEFRSDAGSKFKDPVQYVLSSLRLLYGDSPIQDVRQPVNWIAQLGEPLYAHMAPNGYGMESGDWLSADQMAKRFEVARAIFWNAGALHTPEKIARSLEGLDQKKLQELRNAARMENPIDTFGIYDLMRPLLSNQTSAVLRRTLNMDEWNSLLLSSPEFMYR